MIKLDKYNVKSKKSILNWDEAIPLGNGKIGCLLYGDGPIRLAIDRVDLWDTRVNAKTQEKGFTFENLVKLSTSGEQCDWADRARLFEDIFTEKPYPSKITAGRIELDFGKKTQLINSEVDLFTAIGNFSAGEMLSGEIFLSATKYVGVAKIKGEYSLGLTLPEYLSKPEGKDAFDPNGGFGYPKAEVIKENGYTYYRQQTFTDFSFGIVALEKKVDGVSEIYFTIATSNDNADFIEFAKAELLSASEIGYEALKTEHIKWWRGY